jgi:hypothetical protein
MKNDPLRTRLTKAFATPQRSAFMKKAIARKPNSSPMQQSQDVSDRAWKRAQLAAILAEKTIVKPSTDGRETVSTQNRRVQLEYLVQDAEYLLQAAENSRRILNAYELFQNDSGLLSVEQIRRHFKRGGWKTLTSWASAAKLMQDIVSVLEADSFTSDAPRLPHLPVLDAVKPALWQTPFTGGKGGSKTYRARTILLLAHFYYRERFKDRIEKEL